MTNNGTPCISGGYTNMMTEEDGDLIRRSDALGCFHDWIDKYGDIHTPDEMAEYRAIEELPSVEQEKRTEKRTETHACDLIDRQAAIDALGRIFDRCEEIEAHLPEGDPDRTGYKMYPDYMTVWKYLHQLPSAQPEIIHCHECRWRKDQSGSTAWLPCRAIVTPSDFYCSRAERRTDGRD